MTLDSMIPSFLFPSLAAVAPAVGNHLWQSTVFVAAAGLLTLPLRKNQARVRYGLWLAASAKFLLPFSLLAAMGSHLAWFRTSNGSNAGMYAAIGQVSQPFDRMTDLNTSAIFTAAQPAAAHHPMALVLALLGLAWLCGSIVVLALWSVQWRRVAKIMREAKPLAEGREVETLRRMERIAQLPRRIAMRLSQDAGESLEPGVFGIFRPVLLWPEGISRHLDDAQLEAVLAHEICHVRRRDNLTSVLHMLVEALFWFHPLVWWLEARLVEERERACDEEVLRLGRQPQVYAESILKVCEFCVESPLSCVSGITGADLKKRIVRIMTASLGEGLSGGRKALLAGAAVIAVAVPFVLGQASGSQGSDNLPQFEVATIKPFDLHGGPRGGMGCRVYPGGRVVINALSLKALVGVAFHLDYWQISGGDKWTENVRYVVEAKAPEDAQWKMNPRFSWYGIEDERLREMLQALLIDRFQLKFHRETETGDVYLLEKSGKPIKLVPTEAPSAEQFAKYPTSGGNGNMGLVDGRWVVHDMSVQQIGDFAGAFIWHRPVLDRTGLTGYFDFIWQMDSPGSGNHDEATYFPDLLREMGLKLVPAKGPVETLVIDHAEPPSPN